MYVQLVSESRKNNNDVQARARALAESSLLENAKNSEAPMMKRERGKAAPSPFRCFPFSKPRNKLESFLSEDRAGSSVLLEDIFASHDETST